MRITWHGHSCFEIRDGVVIVTDPHDGKSIGIKPPIVRADLVLVSHEHFDHNCTRIIKGDFHVVRESGERMEKGVQISGFPAFHDEELGSKRGKVVIFKFVVDGMSFCHCGDLGHLLDADQLAKIGKVDVLFVPVGGIFTIDGSQAHRIVEQLNPSIVIPMHFRIGGLSLSINTVDEFIQMAPEDRVIRVGNMIDFGPEDLPATTEFWVFSL